MVKMLLEMKETFIENDIFHFNWEVITCRTEKETEKEAFKLGKRGFDTDDLSDVWGMTLWADGCIVIFLNSWNGEMKNFDHFLSMIRHEVHHLCTSIYEEIDDDVNSHNFIYFNDYIFRKVLSIKAIRKEIKQKLNARS